MKEKKNTSSNIILRKDKIYSDYYNPIQKKYYSIIRKKNLNYNHNKSLFELSCRKNLLNSSIIRFILIFLFILLISHIYCSGKIHSMDLNHDNIILLTIEGGGDKYILSEEVDNSYLPNIIQINKDNVITSPNKLQTLPSGTNNINIIWINQLTTCKNMFKNLNHIIKIDLTNFDFTSFNDMESFFEGCTSLQSVDLSNANAVNVLNMQLMFKNCHSLLYVNFTNFKTNGISSLSQLFFGCYNITSIDLSSFNTPKLIDLSHAFRECSSLKYLNLNNINTSKVTNMNAMFYGCNVLESLNLSHFNTGLVYDMNSMFSNCISFISLDLSNFYTPSLIAMGGMFYKCDKLESLDISNFNTRKVEFMNQVFEQCRSIKSLNLSHFNTQSVTTIYHLFYNCINLEFLDISNFNTDKIDNMQNLFIWCRSLKSLNLSNFNTSLVQTMHGMFCGCSSLEILDISSFNTESVIYMDEMFRGCSSLKSLDLNHFHTPNLKEMYQLFLDCNSLEYINVSNFNTSQVTDMSYVFQGCINLTYIDIGHFKTKSLIHMNNMFYNCQKLKYLDLKNFNTPNLENIANIFSYCHSLESLDISNINTTKITDMSLLFFNCFALKSLNIQNFDTTRVTNMDKMFWGCTQLTTLNLSNFNTELVTNMDQMFEQCHLLNYLDISNFYTPLLENMYHMFYNCYSLTYLDISNLNTSKVQNFEGIFFNCEKLTYLNLSNFDTRSVTTMHAMFENCKNLEYLDLKNFYTPSLQIASQIFKDCHSLKWIDISNFNTSNVTNLYNLFVNCISLTIIDLHNFDTKSVVNMQSLFHNCQALKSINFSNFDTSNTESMAQMFDTCISLTSLDLSHFNTSKVNNALYMFWNCSSLQYLDVSSFNTEKINNMNNLFILSGSLKSLNLSSFTIFNTTSVGNILANTNPNIILCYNESKMPSHFLEQVQFYENNCQKLCIMNSKKFIIELEMCVDNCYNETYYKFEYNDICYSECPIRTQLKNDSEYLCEDCPNYFNYEQTGCIDIIPEGYYNNDILNKTIDKCPNKCKTCSLDSINNNNLCISCNINEAYYPKYNDSSNIDSFYECYKDEQIGFYLDDEEKIFKPCYYKCKKCHSGGDELDNQCSECNDDKNYMIYNGNCIKKSDSTTIINIITTYINERKEVNKTDILSNFIFIDDNSSIKILENENISKIDEELTDIITHDNINKTVLIRNAIDYLILSINYLNLQNFNDIEIIEDDLTIELTSTFNEKKNENENTKKVIINIDKCEKFLKYSYNISYNDSLYLIKIIKNIEGMKIPKVEYEVYYPLYNQSLIKLNLELCKDTKIDVIIPVHIDDNIDKYDPNSNYYNDICSKAISENGTDITLNDRKKEFINKNMSLCEENCELINYNYELEKVRCSCDTKNIIPLFENIKFNKALLYESFIDFNNIINIKILKCYKIIFNESIIRNYGFFIMAPIIFLFFICMIIVPIKSYKNLRKDINNIISALKYKNKNNNKHKIYYNKRDNNRKNKGKNSFRQSSSRLTVKNINELKNVYIRRKTVLIQRKDVTSQNNKKENTKFKSIIEKQNQQKNQKILKYNDFELNVMQYKYALKYDKRTYIQYYISLLKMKHLLIFSFCPYKDYNSMAIKIFLFFFLFSIHLTINVLFFNDTTVHKIYIDNGSFNYVYQIPQILYSSIISGIISSLIRYLSLSQKIIVKLKQEKETNKEKLDNKLKKTLILIKITFSVFFVFSFIILLFCLYYITCFCCIYENTQIHLIKDSIISFLFPLIHQIFICLIPGIFRILALRSKKGSLKIIYRFSSLLSMIL